jgi:hypothetical protein
MSGYNELMGNIIDALLCLFIFIFVWNNFQNISCFTSRSDSDMINVMSIDTNHKMEPKLPKIWIENFDNEPTGLSQKLDNPISEGEAEFVNDRFGQIIGKRNNYNDEQLLELMYARSNGMSDIEDEMILEDEIEKINYINGDGDMNSKIMEKNKRIQAMSKINDTNNMRANRNCLRDDLQLDYEDFEEDVAPWWSS